MMSFLMTAIAFVFAFLQTAIFCLAFLDGNTRMVIISAIAVVVASLYLAARLAP